MIIIRRLLLKMIIPAILILLPAMAFAEPIWRFSGIGSFKTAKVSSPPSGCPSGTYSFAWNGDHPDGTRYACINSGAYTQAIAGSAGSGWAIGGTWGQVGNGLLLPGSNTNIRWAVTADDLIDDEVGTIWMSYYADSTTESKFMFEAENYAHVNSASVATEVVSTNVLQIRHRSTSAFSFNDSNATYVDGTWQRIGVSWDAANNYLATCDEDGIWRQATRAINAAPYAFDRLYLGEEQLGGGHTEDGRVDNVFVIKSYQAADPYP